MSVSATSDCGKQRFTNLIETKRHAAQPEPPFDEGREAIARYGRSTGERTRLPRETDEVCSAGRENDSCGRAAPSLGTTEQRMTVAQHDPPIDGASEARSQELREQNRRPLGKLEDGLDGGKAPRAGIASIRSDLVDGAEAA
jgi:hypothetical protein